jgi:hypothetical protein
LILVNDLLPTQRTGVVSLLDPVLDALRVKKVLLVAIQNCYILSGPKYVPTYDTVLFTVVKSYSMSKLADTPQDIDLMVVFFVGVQRLDIIVYRQLIENVYLAYDQNKSFET